MNTITNSVPVITILPDEACKCRQYEATIDEMGMELSRLNERCEALQIRCEMLEETCKRRLEQLQMAGVMV